MRRVRKWQRGNVASWRCEHVTMSDVEDGTWLVELTGRNTAGHRCRDEQEAADLAQFLTSGPGWFEVPANYDAKAEPTDPGPWTRVGNQWMRPTG